MYMTYRDIPYTMGPEYAQQYLQRDVRFDVCGATVLNHRIIRMNFRIWR